MVKPKNAASMIIYRDSGKARQVLMGRRHDKARFAPGVYVFPGGTFEKADAHIDTTGQLDTKDLPARVKAGIHSLANTAIRETWEETGLFLGQPGAATKSTHPGWRQCQQLGLAPCPQYLRYLGRAITPAASAHRFHARFFVAACEHFSGSLVDGGELSDLHWVPLSDARQLPMFDVTEFMLGELAEFFRDPSRKSPLLYYRNNKTLIRYE